MASCSGVGTPSRCPSAQTPPVFRSSVESVYVDVFVSRGGQPIPGLHASSFELKDNGGRQAFELVAGGNMARLLKLT